MTGTQLIDYAKNPDMVHETGDEPTFISKTVDEAYILALKHAYNHIDINFMAGVDNETTRQEFKDWLKGLGVDVDQQFLD